MTGSSRIKSAMSIATPVASLPEMKNFKPCEKILKDFREVNVRVHELQRYLPTNWFGDFLSLFDDRDIFSGKVRLAEEKMKLEGLISDYNKQCGQFDRCIKIQQAITQRADMTFIDEYKRDCVEQIASDPVAATVKSTQAERSVAFQSTIGSQLLGAYGVSAEAVVRKASVIAALKATGATIEEAAKPIMVVGALALACIALAEGNAAPIEHIWAMAR